MSYVALATDQFEAVVAFYGKALGFPVVRAWDRANARSTVFDLYGLRLEILDAARQKRPMRLPEPGERMHLVVEVDDADAAHRALPIAAPPPVTTSWGARLFSLHDPDGVPVWFLQWLDGHRQ